MGGNAGGGRGGTRGGGGGGGAAQGSELDRIRQVKDLARGNERAGRAAINDEFGRVVAVGYETNQQPYGRLDDTGKAAVLQGMVNSYQSLYTRVGDVRGRFRFNDVNAESNKAIGKAEGMRGSSLKKAMTATTPKERRMWQHKAIVAQRSAYRLATQMSLSGPQKVGPIQSRVK